ncbi:MAG: DUF378 domain-containing protein [Solirubrobacteraceae bacterium]|nr:DUF378 domain-containing protein [Solirubrobacteraceae bacterium]
MDMIRRLDPLWVLLLIVGGLNWAIIALFDTNVVTEIFGTGTLTDVVYCLVGFAALMEIPKLLDGFGMHAGRSAHPTGA